MTRIKGPIGWFGGKGNMVAKILPWFPKHRAYVEVFGGGASLLFNKDPVQAEVYNDIDSNLVAFFRVLRDQNKFAEFYRLICAMPFSREEFNKCRKHWYCRYASDVENAAKWFFIAATSFSGCFGVSMGISIHPAAVASTKYVNRLLAIPKFHKRLIPVLIEHLDFADCIRKYDHADVLFYLDPPYVHTTRKAGGYTNELSCRDHSELVDIMLNSQGMFVLSCYWHDVYLPLLENGYTKLNFETGCYAVGKTSAIMGLRKDGSRSKNAAMVDHSRVETLLISPNCFAKRLRKVIGSRISRT